MSHPTDRPLERAQRALVALRAATDYVTALDAWEDLLVYWGRTVNKAAETKASRFADIKPKVWKDAALKYARMARNADEHGLSPGVAKGGGAAMSFGPVVDLGGGVALDPRSGRVGVSVGDGVALIFHPEELVLTPVTDKDGATYSPPIGADGAPIQPIQLGEYIIGWLEREITAARLYD